MVTSREPDPSATVLRLAECYLTFLTHAQDDSGTFHNRLGYDRRWRGLPGVGDWWGRALWGLGTAAARSPSGRIRDEAPVAFTVGAAARSASPHAMAFAGLGAAEILRADPGNAAAADLLGDAAKAIGDIGESVQWPWPQQRLTYANAALAEVVIAAGELRADPTLLASGLRMLAWLRDLQLVDGRLSVVPAGGWRRGEPRPCGDQQPIEVAALADACATAATATGEAGWLGGVRQCTAWFLGENDAGQPMWDPETGGGYDGLTSRGPNLNQGAESTLALVATLQHARAMA
jgi:hypothetical protein